MSAYTTLRITRSRAKEELYRMVMGSVSDEFLESFMDTALRDRLYNCQIVSDDQENDNDALGGY